MRQLGEILELLDKNDVVAENEVPDREPEPEPIDIAPGRRLGALAWVLIVASAMLVMCMAAVLILGFVLLRAGLR